METNYSDPDSLSADDMSVALRLKRNHVPVSVADGVTDDHN
jgi:hypothetical protein